MSESLPCFVQYWDELISLQGSLTKRTIALSLKNSREIGQKRIDRQVKPPRMTALGAFNAMESGLLDNSAIAAKILTVSSGLENALYKSFRFTVGSVTPCAHQKDNLSR
ncbi:hypothetical protein [Ruegeria sp. 6PALISEP08]|uniref:hypothetical protein n=1 Tax=Ruegeria sp. 6PALISEP08 TaxID=1225660 RepID=UPI00067F4FFB|nr:hypothetical protein [Ruegeria sp. 6PALISEP08]